MTPKEKALKELAAAEAEADAAIRSAQRGNIVQTSAAPSPGGVRRVSTREVPQYDFDNVEANGLESFSVGALDTITLGFSDEIIAGILTPFGERSYQENLRLARGVTGEIRDDNPNTFFTGQIAGGFVPTSRLGAVAGLGRAGTTNLRRVVAESTAYGAAYGFGSADSEELFTTDRLDDALLGGLFGFGGGFILGTAMFQGTRLVKDGYQRLVQMRSGASPRIDFEFKPVAAGSGVRAADDAAEALGDIRSTLPGAPRAAGEPNAARTAINRLTGRTSKDIEPGALASADDIIAPPKKELLFEKLAALTPQQAKVAAKKLMDAMESGDLTKEPHYRSILGLDLKQFGDLEEVIPEVADILFELGEGILTKANLGSRTVKSFEARLRAQYGNSISEGQLDTLTEKVLASQGYATVGKLQMTLAGVSFARSAKDLMPRILAGEREAKTILAEELSKALRVSAKAQVLLSTAGRELGMLRHSTSLVLKKLDDGAVEAESLATITARVNESLAKMDDDALNELLASTRDLSKLEEISKVLLDPVHAEKVGLWLRTRNTATAFLKSNTLTPATAVVNLVGVPVHNWLRNSGARQLAEAAARASGDDASALVIAAQRQAADAVRWEARKQGVVAAFRRIKWESLGSLRDIASVAGATKVAARASASRQALIASGYRPPAIREYDLAKRLAVTDVAGFNRRLAERAQSDMPFASFVNALERTGAVALNAVDALGTATAKLASGTLDDFGRALIMTRETYAEMAGQATRQALKEGKTGDDLAARVRELSEEWSTLPPREILERVERKLVDGDGLDEVDTLLIRRDYNAEEEAGRVLFLDGPQTSAGRTVARTAELVDEGAALLTSGGILKGALIPYVNTPTRILERGLASYTPWGKFTDEVRKALDSPDPVVRAVEQARMDLGGTILSAGMLAAATGAITITNGADYQNSANLGGVPALRVNLPAGGYVEFGRLDPIAMGLAMGGVIGQMFKASQEAGDRYGQDDAIATAMAVAYGGFRDAILNKSYLTGMNQLFEAISSKEEGALENYFARFYPDVAGRLIPFSGTSRQLNETISGKSLEAATALDRIAKVTPGMGAYLPARVDALGNAVDANVFGFRIGTSSDDDDVTQKLRGLGVDINNLAKADPSGFGLTSEELSELRRIRGTEAYNADGLTMREALSQLFSDPRFQSLPDKQQVQDEVVAVMREFNEPAREIFEQNNQGYLADREAARSFKAYLAEGLVSREEARRLAAEDARGLGLTPTRTDSLE
jgi:hypothetical protein